MSSLSARSFSSDGSGMWSLPKLAQFAGRALKAFRGKLLGFPRRMQELVVVGQLQLGNRPVSDGRVSGPKYRTPINHRVVTLGSKCSDAVLYTTDMPRGVQQPLKF